MRISDWSSDVCSSDLAGLTARIPLYQGGAVASRVRQAQAQQSQALENMVLTERFVVNQARAPFANLQTARGEGIVRGRRFGEHAGAGRRAGGKFRGHARRSGRAQRRAGTAQQDRKSKRLN